MSHIQTYIGIQQEVLEEEEKEEDWEEEDICLHLWKFF